MFPYPVSFIGDSASGTPFENLYSMAFDGVDDYINAGSSIPNLETGDISFSAWTVSYTHLTLPTIYSV